MAGVVSPRGITVRKLALPSLAGRSRSIGEVGAMVIVFAVLRTIAVVHAPGSQPDTNSYLVLNFLGEAERLWTVPLVWNAFPGADLREAVQLLLGIVSWSVLAVGVGKAITGLWTRRVAVATVLMLGLVPQVAGWDAILLSESISTSLLVLLVGVLVWLGRRPSLRLVGGCLVVATLWMFTRQLNVLLFVITLPFVIAFTVRRGPRRHRLAIIAALLLIALWGGWAVEGPSSGSGGVWKWNAVQILEERIAPNPQALQFFYAHGLPRSPAILADQGSAFRGSVSPVFADQRVMNWISHDFKKTYLSYLVKDLRHTVGRPLVHFIDSVSGTTPSNARTVLPVVVSQELWNTSIVFWLIAAVVIAVGVYVRGSRIRGAPLILLLLITAVGGSIVTWNTTGYALGGPEFARLFLPIAVMFRVAVLLTIFFSVDALRLTRRTKPALTPDEHQLTPTEDLSPRTLAVR